MPSKCVICEEPDVGQRCPQCGAASAPGGYVVERLVAQTAHSRLYLAVAPDGRRVALKELVFSLVPGARELDAFHREVSLLEGLDVPGVPRFIASFQEGRGVGTRLYLAQDFVEGVTLLERLRAGPLDEAAVVDVARQVLEILHRLHSRTPAVLHRDVKPANLVAGDDGQLVLVDFGAARLLQADVTYGATLVGTVGYMAPEQLGGSVDPSTDLYSLGATLAHLLSGEHPSALVDGTFVIKVDERIPGSKRFKAWLSRLVAPRRATRFASAKEALDALEETLRPVKTSSSTAANRSLVAALAIFFVAALGGIVVLETFDDGQSSQTTRLQAPVKERNAFDRPVPAMVQRARASIEQAAEEARTEVLPPVEVVSLERVLAPGERRAFWLDRPMVIERPDREKGYYGYARVVRRAEEAKLCRDEPATGIERVVVTFPTEITSGALLHVEMERGRSSYATASHHAVSGCDDVRAALRTSDGVELRRVREPQFRDWLLPRNVPRLTLTLGEGTKAVEVEIDLERGQMVLPG